MKTWYLTVTPSEPAETDARRRIQQVISFGRRLGLHVEFAGERPPPPVRSAKARRELIQQAARVQP